MKARCGTILSACATLMLALAATPGALAQCGMPSKLIKPSSWQPLTGGAHLMRAALNDDQQQREDEAPIVGMWHVTFTANTSNGTTIPNTVVDNALAVWHSDKTEIMNSVRPPQDGNFCMGVWQQKGRDTYCLNHFAWFANQFPNSTNNGIGDPVGPTHITESVTLAPDRNHFTGTFTLDAYDTSGNVVQSFTGAITATRITVDTSMSDLL